MIDKISVYSKGRNIIYYRELDLGIRPRATYIHILRLFRKEVGEVIKEMSQEDPYFSFFLEILNTVPEKPKTKECDGYIIKLKQIYDNRRIEENV